MILERRSKNGYYRDADETLFEWTMSAISTGRDIDDIADEKYGWVLRAIELANSDDPFSITLCVTIVVASFRKHYERSI